MKWDRKHKETRILKQRRRIWFQNENMADTFHMIDIGQYLIIHLGSALVSGVHSI